jgi:oligopeptide transport system substrate-binding protein
MRPIFKFINVFALVVVLAGCSAKKENILRVNMGGEPHTLDPRKARDLQSLTIAKMFFDGLTRINKDEKPELAIAEKVDISADGKTYTFTLRPAMWSNGVPVTAQDFVYAWTRVLDPHFPADQAFQLYVIKNAKAVKEGKVAADQLGVQAINTKILRVELTNPVPYFLELTALPVFFPIAQKIDQSDSHWADKGESVVGNGPFVLKEWKHSDHLHVVRSPSYWDTSHVKIKEIDLLMVNEDTELKMFERGELDWAGSPLSTLPVGALAQLKKSGELHVKPFLATYFFRTNVESEPFQNPLMRKAFALAIQRSDIVEHVTQGGQLPATGLLPPSLGVQEKPYFADGDIATAKQDFEKALGVLGMTRETLPQISLMYIAGERNHLIAQAVQEQWRSALGITVTLHAVERKIFYDRVSKKNFQIAAGSWTADFNDGMNFLEVFKFKAGGSNNTAWEHAQYKELLDKATEVNGAAERKKIFNECETLLMKEMPIIPLFHYTMLYLSNQRVKDVVLSNLGSIDFKWAYIDEIKK